MRPPSLSLLLTTHKFSNPPTTLLFLNFPMAQEEAIVTEPSPAQQSSPKKPTQEPSPPAVVKSGSFREESNLISDLQESEKTALDELKSLLQSELTAPPPPPAADPPAPAAEPAENADDGSKTVEAIESTVVPAPSEAAENATNTNTNVLWGVPLLKDERTDTILLKFLRARDFKARDSMEMIRQTLKWREEFEAEKLMEEDLGIAEMSKAVFMSGADKKGHPVCYNVYGEFQNKELYEKAFGDGQKRGRFLRWRIQYLEKGIRELLDFSPAGVSTMVQVTDLKDSPGLLKAELRQALDILQNNYPEFVAKQVYDTSF